MIYSDSQVSVPVSLLETDERLVCVFCDNEVSVDIPVCMACGEYKGIMTVSEWEAYTGESWD